MTTTATTKRIKEWGDAPEEGMILIGFSCPAEVSGRELKRELVDIIKSRRNLGFREAVSTLKRKSLASFDDAKRMVEEICRDLQKGGDACVMGKTYSYNLTRIFWGYDEDMPKNDPRYFRLQPVNIDEVDMTRFEREDGSIDPEKFVREFIDEADRAKLGALNRLIESRIEAPETNAEGVDAEWDDKRI